MPRTNIFLRFLLASLLAHVLAGCGQKPAAPVRTGSPAAPARTPHQTLLLEIEFDTPAHAAGSRAELVALLPRGVEVENGPFVVSGQPFIRLAVSLAPHAPREPLLQQLRTVRHVQNVKVVR